MGIRRVRSSKPAGFARIRRLLPGTVWPATGTRQTTSVLDLDRRASWHLVLLNRQAGSDFRFDPIEICLQLRARHAALRTDRAFDLCALSLQLLVLGPGLCAQPLQVRLNPFIPSHLVSLWKERPRTPSLSTLVAAMDERTAKQWPHICTY